MKKIMNICLIICFVFLLTSCEALTHKHIVSENWSHDEQFHWKITTCNQNRCLIEYTTFEHVDEDHNMVCDICNYQLIKLELDNVNWLYSDTHHWYLPEGEENFAIVYGYGEHTWNEGVEVESGTGGYIMEYTCTICGKKHQEITTIIPPTPVFIDNLSFAIEDKTNELVKHKTIILANINSSDLSNSISTLFDECIEDLKNAENIFDVKELADKCLKDAYDLIPLANGDFDFSNLSDNDKKEILSLLDDYIFRNNLGGVPLSQYYTLNLNSTTKEQWIEFFGEEGIICQTPKNEYWDVKEFLSNKYFLKGLCLALPKEETTNESSIIERIDYSKYEFYNYDLELARKYFAVAMEELAPIYSVAAQYPIELKLEIAFGSKTAKNEQLFNTLKTNIETAFNDQSVSNGNFVLTVEAWYGEYFGQIYPDKNYNGQFDLSCDKISLSSYDKYMYYNLLSSNPNLSNDLTINWSIDTNNIEDDCIVYNEYRYSYDALLSLLSSKYTIIDGVFYKVILPQLESSELNKLTENIGENHYIQLYLGEYSGYHVWFECDGTEVLGYIEIGNYYFEYYGGFELYAYKDGVVKVIDLYNAGILLDSDIKQIEEYYYYAYDNGII